MKISIVGTGYVGLVTGVCLATKGHRITCYDNNEKIITDINNGKPNIYEPGLNSLLKSVLKNGNLRAHLISNKTLFNEDLIIIAVDTPLDGNGKINLSNIITISEQIGNYLKKNNNFLSIIVKSTVIPGTTDNVIRKIIENCSKKKLGDFGLGMNPEFLREGSAIQDFMEPDRIVLGHEDNKTLSLLKKLYKSWNCDKLFVNTRTAEMIKYANNSLLALQISAANELANIVSEIGGIDILEVMNGVYADKRWSPRTKSNKRISPEILTYLAPGAGFGGSCLPKDLQALCSRSSEIGVETKIFNAVLAVNENQPYQIIKILERSLNGLDNKKILLLGLAFKNGTNDIRGSVSLKIINYLLKNNAQISAHDPIAIDSAMNTIDSHKNLSLINEWEKELSSIDAVLIIIKSKEYKKLASSINRDQLNGKVIFDVKRFFSPDDFPESDYITVGRNK